MASRPEIIMEDHSVAIKQELPRCGAPSDPREVLDDEKALFEKYRDLIEPEIRGLFNVPANVSLQPTKVRVQVVAGTNYYFHIPLPTGQFAHVRIFKPLKNNNLDMSDRTKFFTVEKEAKNE